MGRKFNAKLYIYASKDALSYKINLDNLNESLEKLSRYFINDPSKEQEIRDIRNNIDLLLYPSTKSLKDKQGEIIDILDIKLKKLKVSLKSLNKRKITPQLAAVIKELCGSFFGGGLIQKVLNNFKETEA